MIKNKNRPAILAGTGLHSLPVRMMSVILSLFMCIALMSAEALADNREIDALKESIKEKQASIEEVNKQKSGLSANMTDIQKTLSSLKSIRDDLNAYVATLDAKLNEILARIEELENLIQEKEQEIEVVKRELEEARAVEQEQYEAMKMRIRFMYEHGKTMFIELLLESRSLGDLLSRTEYVERVTEYDRAKLEEFQAVVDRVEVLEQQLQAEMDLLEEAREVQKKEEETLNSLIAEKESEIAKYDAEIKDQEKILAEYQAELAQRNSTIAALEAAVKAEKQKLTEAEQANMPKYGGGAFAWPAPSYTRLSDDYGNRMHPTLKVEQFHNGIDLAAPSGSAILSAADGVVAAADYNASMGNYIMIDHGSDLYTIYMHASKLSVSKGAKVSKGQRIGSVGSTGRSTGPHLHFGVRKNGNYISPWNYLSR